MAFKLSDASRAKLAGVKPSLVSVVMRAIEISPVDFKVVEGLRSDEQAYVNFGKGRTISQCNAKGVPSRYSQPGLAKVTWLNDPLATKHRRQNDGWGHAVDLLPAPYDWKNLGDFDRMAKAVLQAAHELGVNVRWGADWDADGKPREKGETDSPHFELADH